MTVRCWAKAIGGCGVQSREHYISRSLWKGDTITVKGLWNSGETTIGLGSLTAKILCKPHNELLSKLDDTAKKVFDTIEEVYRLHNVRIGLPRTKFWRVVKHSLNGLLFERWTAKFLVGFLYVIGKDEVWHDSQTGPLEPPEHIVHAIFGTHPFPPRMGLYTSYEVGDEQVADENEGLSVAPLFHGETKGLVGASLDFKGMRFIIWLTYSDIKSFDIPSSSGRVFGPNGSEAMYHIRKDEFKINGVLSQVVEFRW